MSKEQLVPQTPSDLAPFIDHTLLKPEVAASDILRLCQEAKDHRFYAVCVNPVWVQTAAKALSGSSVKVAAVVGFPLGASTPTAKAFEAAEAVQNGAHEVDMVISIGQAKAGDWNAVESDISAVVVASRRARPDAVIKVILETGLLTADMIRNACAASERAGADFVKTATGFLGRGVINQDVEVMRLACKLKIKASGGVKSFAQAQELIARGATRLGTSSGISLVTGDISKADY
jgi:deoxyribose-phosphate aldolase